MDLISKKENAPVPSPPIGIPTKYVDLTQAKIASWSEFASWNHLENSGPYWQTKKTSLYGRVRVQDAIHSYFSRMQKILKKKQKISYA